MLGSYTTGLNTHLSLIGKSVTQSPQLKIKSLTHDIASPLTAIKLNLDLLNNNDAPDTATISRIYKGIDHIEHIIEQELKADNSAGMERQYEPWTVCGVIDEVLNLNRTAVEIREIEIKKEYFADRKYHNIPGAIFFRVVNNLLTNAIDALVSGRKTGRMIWISVYENYGDLVVSVRDNGKGVPDHIKTNLFKRPATSKRNGHGLGLWGSLQSIKSNFGGDIIYRPNKLSGGGAVFEIII